MGFALANQAVAGIPQFRLPFVPVSSMHVYVKEWLGSEMERLAARPYHLERIAYLYHTCSVIEHGPATHSPTPQLTLYNANSDAALVFKISLLGMTFIRYADRWTAIL